MLSREFLDDGSESRFLRAVSSMNCNGCMDWIGGVDRLGYGVFHIGKRSIGSHRVAWVLANGAIDTSQHVLHRCDNPKCCNPEHLFLGNALSNAKDRNAKKRHAHGEKSYNTKLTNRDVAGIKKLRRAGLTASAICNLFPETTISQVYKMCSGRQWKHVN